MTSGARREALRDTSRAGASDTSRAGASDTSRDVVYLDHAATSRPKPPPVAEAITAALALGAPDRSAHALGIEASRVIHEARAACAELLGVPDARDLLIQSGCTAALNVVLKGILSAGDRVIVSSMEHNAVVRPLAALEHRGVTVDVVGADATGRVDAEAVEAMVSAAPTKVVVCQHASNLTGTIQPLPDLVDIAHAAGAVLVADGAQAFGHLDVDIGAIGVDAYAVAGHKGVPGPQGVGLLYLSPDLEVRELIHGGTGGNSASPDMPVVRPSRYEAGTANTPGIAGLGAAARWVAEHGRDVREREGRLAGVLAEGLGGIPGVRLLGPAADEPRVPVVSVVCGAAEPDRLAHELDTDYGVATRAGLHCTPWAHRTLGTIDSGALRFSLGWSTTEDDVVVAIEAMGKALAGRVGRG